MRLTVTEAGGHAPEGALVDAAIGGAREGDAVMLQFNDGGNGLAAHVLDGVLVAEPVGALDRVVHVPAPVILAHVAQRRADAALRRDSVAAGRKDLGDAGSLESLLGQPQRRPEASSARAYHQDVVFVADQVVVSSHDVA